MTSKLINIIGQEGEVHTLIVTRLTVSGASPSEAALLVEAGIKRQIITMMTIIGGTYVGTQWAHLHESCTEELRTVYKLLLTEEGWNAFESGDRVSLTGEKLPRLEG